MKKICYVTTIPMTIEAFFIPQLRYLANKGFDVTVVCSPNDTLQEKLGDQIHFVPLSIPRGISIIGTIRAEVKLARVFKKEKFDLIQYSTPNAAFCSSIAAKKADCKIRNYHLMGFRYLGASGLLRMILRRIEIITCKNSTSIECVSKSNLQIGVSDKIFPKEKALVVWNGSSGGVDLKRFDYSKREQWRRQIRKELCVLDKEFLFGFAGRITRDKGVNELLEAFLSIDGICKLVLIGVMENTKQLNLELIQKAKQSNRVLFLSYVNDIERYYAAMDVLVLPSYREGFGMVIAEAAAVGTPSIISNIPGPIDVVEEGKTALTVKIKDVADLRKQMETLLEKKRELKAEDCVQYIRNAFDCELLNEKIYERKLELLSEGIGID